MGFKALIDAICFSGTLTVEYIAKLRNSKGLISNEML